MYKFIYIHVGIYIYIYTLLYKYMHVQCMYTLVYLTYFDSGRLADAGGGWCLVMVSTSKAASHFWFKTIRTAVDWTRTRPVRSHVSNNPFPNIINHQKTHIFLVSQVMPCNSSSTFSLAVLVVFLAFDEKLHGYPIDSSSASLHQHHTSRTERALLRQWQRRRASP